MIIEEMRAFLRLDLNPRQHKYFSDTIDVAKRVEVVPVSEVFNEREIELIRRVVRPEKQACYKNAHLLTLLFPERVRYCEGKTLAIIPIDHAFNKVGDKYVDITFEMVLKDDKFTGYEYVVFGEYPAGIIKTNNRNNRVLWGNIPILLLCGTNGIGKRNPRQSIRTTGGGTQ